MIWLKEQNIIGGFIIILNKKYTIEEIREMSNYHHYTGWSQLSTLVMKLQGISYKTKFDTFPAYKALIDVTSNLDFECLWHRDYSHMKAYIYQIFNVFKNMTFYELDECSEEEFLEMLEEEKEKIRKSGDLQALNEFDSKFGGVITIAEHTKENLVKLSNIFSEYGLYFSHDLLEEATEEIIEKAFNQI